MYFVRNFKSFRIKNSLFYLTLFLIILLFSTNFALGNELLNGLPALSVSQNGNKTEYSLPLQILILMSALTILPSLVLGMTSFTRIIIVMSILRQALGTQQTPPNQVLIAISLFLTFFIMAPTFNKVYDEAAVPYMKNEHYQSVYFLSHFLIRPGLLEIKSLHLDP